MKKIRDKLKGIPLNPPLYLSIGFLILIFTGALILNTKVVSRNHTNLGFINALFTSASASCVTGLTVVNTSEFFNPLGHLVIMFLIQVGGLGIMTMATIFPLVMKKRIGIASRQIIKEQLNLDTMSGLIVLLKYVIEFTLIVEVLGSLLLATQLIPIYGFARGIWYSLFHSVSAFCNAGFDLFGDSLLSYQEAYIINIVIMALVVIGGLGFAVSQEILNKRRFKSLSVHSKIVIVTTIALIIVGAGLFYILEKNNPMTIGNKALAPGLLASFFQSVAARTAGFYSLDLAALDEATCFLIIILMFIGASPGSTGGGLKTTTFAVIARVVISTIKGKKDPVVFNKKIPSRTIIKALVLLSLGLATVITITFSIAAFEDFAFLDIFFETTSAFGTVGSSRGITGSLTNISKFLLTLTMYTGRVGLLTIAYGISKEGPGKLGFPEANISIG